MFGTIIAKVKGKKCATLFPIDRIFLLYDLLSGESVLSTMLEF
jgi:hypothetical protein